MSYTTVFRYRIDFVDDPNFTACDCPETISHILLDRVRDNDESQELLKTLQTFDQRPLTGLKVLGHRNNPKNQVRAGKALLEFLVHARLTLRSVK